MDKALGWRIVLPTVIKAGQNVHCFPRLGGLNFESQNKGVGSDLAIFTTPGDYYFSILLDKTLPSVFDKGFAHLRVRGYSYYIFQEIRSLSSPNIVYVRSKTSGDGSFGEWMKLS